MVHQCETTLGTKTLGIKVSSLSFFSFAFPGLVLSEAEKQTKA
jgi:hypothetical protein